MKIWLKYVKNVIILIMITLFVSCKGSVDSNQSETKQNFGAVCINFSGGNERTVLPSEIDISKLFYKLEFTKADNSESIFETQNGAESCTFELSVGTWDLEIKGFYSENDASDSSKALVSYSQTGITISYGNNVTINAKLIPYLENLTQNGSGSLRYNIYFPEGTAGVLKIYNYPDKQLVGEPIVFSATENSGSVELLSGYYDLSVSYEYQGKIKIWSEIIHIYDNAITEISITSDDFTDFLPPPGPVDVYLSMDKFTMTDEGEGVFDGIEPILLRKGMDSSETIAIEEFVVVEWKIGEQVIGNENVIILNSDFFPYGTYSLNVTFIKNGKPWLGCFTFEVTGNLPDECFELITEDNKHGWVWFDENDELHNFTNNVGTYRVIGSDTLLSFEKIYIPAFYKGLPVTEISMRRVDESSLIGAFQGVDANEIYMPDTINFIDGSSFSGTNISEINIPKNVEKIGEHAFEGCRNLISVEIPEGVLFVGSNAFANCINLESIKISSSVRGFGGAIKNCPKLTNIIVDDNNNNYTSEGRVLFSKDKKKLIAYPSASGEVIIPSGIESIEPCAFSGSSITSVIVSDGVTIIDPSAFSMCRNLTNVVLPKGLEFIEQAAFANSGLSEIIIPSSVTYIGPWAFQSENLVSVTFEGVISPENLTVEEIGYSFNSFPGDLGHKYLEYGIGTYIRSDSYSDVWTKL